MKPRNNGPRTTIGLILDNLFNDYEQSIWKWIACAAEEKDINLLCFLGGSLHSPLAFHSQRNQVYSLVSPLNVDGIIAMSGSIGSYVNASELASYYERYQGIPFVSIGIPFSSHPSVIIDNSKGLQELITHLIDDHGFTKIGFIKGPEASQDAAQRFDAYRKTLEERGLRYNPDLVVQGDFVKRSGAEAVSILLFERKVKCEALIAANDYMAIGAIEECSRREVRVPQDLAVAGFDDIDDASGMIPSLTTVRQPYYELGRQAIEVISQIIAGNAVPEQIVFPTKCVIRHSCGCELLRDIAEITPAYIPANPGVGTGASMSVSLQEKNSVAGIASEIELLISGFRDRPKIMSLAQVLYDSYVKALKTKDYAVFTCSIESLMADIESPVSASLTWLRIISSVFRTVIPGAPCEEEKTWLAGLWQHAAIFVSLLGETQALASRANSEERARVLLRINNSLIASYDASILNRTLLEELPTLGISSCFYSIYEKNQAGLENSRLAFSYSKHGNIQCNNKYEAFSSKCIIPGKIKNPKKRFTGIILPLYFEDDQIGFVLFEIGPKNGSIYETLASQISSVLKGSELTLRVRQHAEYLEKAVRDRTSDLKGALAKLESEIEIRHKVEEDLVREKELAMVTLASIGDGVITTDNNGTVTYLNAVACNLTGFKQEEARGAKLKDVLNVRYNISHDLIGDQVDIVLGKDRSFKLSGAVMLRSKDGREYTIKESISPIRDASGNHVGVVIIIHNVSETEKMSKLINFQSTHDLLTGVYNRIKFNEILSGMMNDARHEKKEHIFCYIDIDGFKLFNNTLNTVAGDELLRHVSSILKCGIRQSDVLGRIGGDQFGLLLSSCPLTRAKEIAFDIKEKISDSSFVWETSTYKVSVSTGIVLINVFSDDIAGVMSAAHAACNLAKKRGGNRIHVWSPENEDMMRFHSDLYVLPQISKALDEDRFCLYKQKIHPLGNIKDDSEHYEILIRMIGEGNQLISPAGFIPAAERYNIMPKIDRWVISKLFSSYKVDFYDQPERMIARYSINLSASTLDDDDFLEFLMGQFEHYKIPPFMICFEITETTAISNFKRVNEFIKEMKKLGCTFSLDDFGTGWASFAYLKYLHIDFLKIDGSFVRDITHDPIDFVLVETINHIGHVMGLQTIAEFVEDSQTLAKIEEIGVNYAQGFGISMPEPF